MRALVDRNNAGRGLMQGANTTNEKDPRRRVDGGWIIAWIFPDGSPLGVMLNLGPRRCGILLCFERIPFCEQLLGYA
jgi:hypothetical protein